MNLINSKTHRSKIKRKSSDVNGEVSTQSATTQIKPTFSRQDLGAELSFIKNNNAKNLNSGTKHYKSTDQTET